jgi:formylglycine-generating enzyme required for sulfatase activity/uncharacterized caspase-like protein
VRRIGGNKLSARSSIFGKLTAALVTAVMVLCASAPANAVANEDAVAVVIGNSNYTADRIPKVDYAHRDAAAFKRYLIDVQGYREGNIIDLRDATQAQMEAALGNDRTHEGTLWQYIRPEGSDVTVFYSGHGVPGLKSKRGYLLPVDADPNKPEINGYPVDTLYANLAKLPARSVTVYLDACFSGDSPKGMLINATSGITVRLKLPEKRNKLTILTAATGDQVASWDTENRHGLFTEHLMAALYGAADGPRYGIADGRVTLGEVKKYLARNMTYAAKRTYGRIQHATINGSEGVVLAALGTSHPKRPVIATGTKKAASLPPPTVQVEEMDAIYLVVKRANIRSGPGTSFAKVIELPPGEAVGVTGKVRGKDWYRIALANGGQGYVWGPLLSEQRRTEKRRGDTKVAVGIYPKGRQPGDTFKDCANCPEMVVIPSGNFLMGDLRGDGEDEEKPVHKVKFGYSFAVSRYEVTMAEWRACLRHGSCVGYQPDDHFDKDRHPVHSVNWRQSKAFAGWLRQITGSEYRLLSEAEWEYVARAGSNTKYSWGNLFDENLASNKEYHLRLVGSFEPNAFGLYDVHGNVSEWVEDCWHDEYHGAPTDGSARSSGGECSHRILRGGSTYDDPEDLRAAYRSMVNAGYRTNNVGFRVARTLSR